jgi:hypothetical protein
VRGTAKSDKSADGACGFCGQYARLRDSHVLPAFVYRWLRNRSGTGHIRLSENPNRRVQDGLKFKWLCEACETKFSKFETAFATKVFHPWNAGIQSVAYDDWMLKFCVSVSWRVLKYAYGRNKQATYSSEQKLLVQAAEEKWRDFLNDNAIHPGAFEQHLLIADVMESTSIRDLPTNINRFMTGAITLDIVGSDRSMMTFAKLGRFMIFGMIQKGPNKWEGTKVHVRHGVLKPGKFIVPIGLLDLIREKASNASDMMAAISPAQLAKIDSHITQNIDEFLMSDQFKAIAADAEMFGDEAVTRKK